MIHQRRYLIAVLLLMLGASACASAGSGTAPAVPVTLPTVKNAEGFVDLSGDQLAEMLKHKDFTLINVHVPYDGEIEQTDDFIVFDQIDQHLAELPAKDAPIVLYCSSGRMSTIAAQTLVKLGYTNVFELDGGFTAWRNAGREVLRLLH